MDLFFCFCFFLWHPPTWHCLLNIKLGYFFLHLNVGHTHSSRTVPRHVQYSISTHSYGTQGPVMLVVLKPVETGLGGTHLALTLLLEPSGSGPVVLIRLGAIWSSGPLKRSRNESGRSSSSWRLLCAQSRSVTTILTNLRWRENNRTCVMCLTNS